MARRQGFVNHSVSARMARHGPVRESGTKPTGHNRVANDPMSEKDYFDPDELPNLFGPIFDRSDHPARIEVRPAKPELTDEPEPLQVWGRVVLLAMAGGLLLLVVLAWEVLLPLALFMGWGILKLWVTFGGRDG